ncbi:MAG TPA: VIT1/CCC1 transporter family protein [Acidimicrobiales bacterium]
MADEVHEERHRQVSDGWVRAGIFGVSDGLVTNVSLILGFAGANPGHNIVRLAGLAGLVAGGFSMASGEYLSMRAQKELLEYEIDIERKSIAESPEAEQEELRQLFLARGIEDELAQRLSVDLMRDPDLALRTHAREELGVDPSATGSPWRAAISSLIAFSLGAFVPLLPWLWSATGNEVWWSVGLATLGAAGVGGAIGWFTRRGTVKWATRQVLVAALAAVVTFGVGRLVGG